MPKYEVEVEREGATEGEQGYTLTIFAANANSAKEKAEASFIGGFNAVKARKVDEDEEPGDPVELTAEQLAELEVKMDEEAERRADEKLKAALEDQEAEIERQVQERIAKLEEERASEAAASEKAAADAKTPAKPASK